MKNTNKFYSHLGEALSTMKNSPFMKIGALPSEQININSQNKLDFAPDRLFDPEKHKKQQQLMMKESMHNKEDLEMLKEQRRHEQEVIDKIHYDLLKKNVEEQYQKEAANIDNNRQYSSDDYYTIYGVYRGVCTLCKHCGKYQGNFHIQNGQFDSQNQFMSCLKCGCPMNSHTPYYPKNPHKKFILKQLIKCSVQDSHINVNYSVIAFKQSQQKNKQKPNSLYPSYLISLMQAINYPVLSYRILTRKQFEIILLKTLILKDNSQIDRGYLQALLSLLDNLKTVDVSDQSNDVSWFEELEMNQFTEDINQSIKKLAKQLLTKTTFNIYSSQSSIYDQIMVMLVSGEQFGVMTQLLRSQQFKPQLKDFHFVYSSHQSHKQSLIGTQNFFPKKFNLQYKIFLLPNTRQSRQRNSQRFKDILDYNNYIMYVEDPKNIQRSKFQKAFSQFSANKINFILAEELLSQKITRIPFKYVGKVGDHPFQIPIENPPDYLQISDQMEIKKSLKTLYPQITFSQRCVIILRPFLLNENYEEIVVNLLRINNFAILSRVKTKVTENQAAYLATIENIDDQLERLEYINYMTSGVCQVILCSKRSAIYDAFALVNGCFEGRNDSMRARLKKRPIIQMKRGRDTYQYQLSTLKPKPNKNIFNSVKQLINIENVLFPYSQSAPHFLTNVKTGEILKLMPGSQMGQIKKQSYTSKKNSNLVVSSISPKLKASLLSSIPLDKFNYWCMSSKSETITQELCSLFLPQCTLFEPIIVLLKPHLSHLITPVLNLLKQHKYHIIQHKKVMIPKMVAAQLIINLQKVRITDKNQLKNIIDLYSSRQVQILCLSKVSGRREMMRMLSQFEFVGNFDQLKSHKSMTSVLGMGVELGDQTDSISDQQLKSMLIPIWNSQQLIYGLISQYLQNLQDAVKILQSYSQLIHNNTNAPLSNIINREDNNTVPKAQIFKILNYFIGSFYGVSIQDLNLSTKIGKLSYYVMEESYIAKQQSWYYSQVSMKYPNYVPLLFQYRGIGQTILCIQTDRGYRFLEMIEKMYFEEKAKIQEKLEKQDNFYMNKKHKNKRKSLVLFLWAKKLYEFLTELATIETQLKGFGEIWEKQGEHRGHYNLNTAAKQEEDFLLDVQDIMKDYPEIHKNIKKMLNSRCLKQRFEKYNLRLLPKFNQFSINSEHSYQQSIRIVQKSHASKLILMDKHQFIDPENQHKQEMKDLYSLVLYNIIPEIRTKYMMFAEVYILLRKKQVLSHGDTIREEMYHEFLGLFSEMISHNQDLEFLEYEIYLKTLLQYFQIVKQEQQQHRKQNNNIDQFEQGQEILHNKLMMKDWFLSLLKNYPNLRKLRRLDNDDVAGKKRKFLDHKQYFIRNDEKSEEVLQKIEKKYQNVDLTKFTEPKKPSVLYNPDDALHYRLANTQNRVNLLRNDQQQADPQNNRMNRKGINVEYEKNISEKEEQLKNKIKKEVDRFTIRDDRQEILHETGLQKQLWYRRTKGMAKQQPESKTNIAIQKQIGKFLQYKKEEQQKILDKQI